MSGFVHCRSRGFAAAALSGLALSLIAAAAGAQAPCWPRGELVASLLQRFGERQVGLGLVADNRLLEHFASPKGTWTTIVTRADGTACVIASGTAWQPRPQPDEPRT